MVDARSHGLRRGTGVNMVPSPMRSVRIAAAVSEIQGSLPQSASQPNTASQPASSAATAIVAKSAASPLGKTIPYRMVVSWMVGVRDCRFLAIVDQSYDNDGDRVDGRTCYDQAR